MAKQFYGNGLAQVVTRFSTSAPTVIAATVIAAPGAARKPVVSSGSGPTGGTNRARKGSSTIVTGSGSTGAETGKYKLA